MFLSSLCTSHNLPIISLSKAENNSLRDGRMAVYSSNLDMFGVLKIKAILIQTYMNYTGIVAYTQIKITGCIFSYVELTKLFILHKYT